MTLFQSGSLTILALLFALIRLAGLTVTIQRAHAEPRIRHRTPRQAPTKKRYNGPQQKPVEMLQSVQQEVLSALVNQGLSFTPGGKAGALASTASYFR